MPLLLIHGLDWIFLYSPEHLHINCHWIYSPGWFPVISSFFFFGSKSQNSYQELPQFSRSELSLSFFVNHSFYLPHPNRKHTVRIRDRDISARTDDHRGGGHHSSLWNAGHHLTLWIRTQPASSRGCFSPVQLQGYIQWLKRNWISGDLQTRCWASLMNSLSTPASTASCSHSWPGKKQPLNPGLLWNVVGMFELWATLAIILATAFFIPMKWGLAKMRQHHLLWWSSPWLLY